MGRKKDIGNVFQEKFKDLRESPSEELWDAITSEIDQKSNRRALPFWYYIGVAVLVTALIIGFSRQPWNKKTKDSITTIEKIDNSNKISDPINNKTKDSDDLFIYNNRNADVVETTSKEKKSVTGTTNHKENTTQNISTLNVLNTERKAFKANNVVTSKDTESTTLLDIKEQLIKLKKEKAFKEQKAREAYRARIKQELDEAIAVQKEENKKTQATLEKEQTIDALTIKKKLQQEQEDIAKAQKESSLPKTEEKRALDRKEATEYTFAISPFTSFLNYGSLARGSSIDNRLANNPRESISTTGYGLRVDYRLNEKISLRFGAGAAPLRYRTNNFQVSSIDGNINIFQLSGIATEDLNQPGIETSLEAQAFFQQNQVVSIEQDISYIEVPVDLQYRFLNKRIALSLNTGISLFVLTDNSVFATADNGQSILIGRETDLNDLSLAFNLGLGTHYNFSKRWRLDAEPAFKYQLNPYTNTNSNFRPYYFGMQFGLSYKF